MVSKQVSIQPLADKMRPQSFAEFFGQEEIVGEGKLLRKLIEQDQLSSLVFWGPPGVGKTTLANVIAQMTDSHFVVLSAVNTGKKDLQREVSEAKEKLDKKTILFIDEIHRWSKVQQDALLPHVEKGDIILIGATTENPSFEIIGPLLSRSRVFILKSLEDSDIIKIINNVLNDKERGLGNYEIKIGDDVKEMLAGLSGGDARTAINGLELAVKAKTNTPHPSGTPLKRGSKGSLLEEGGSTERQRREVLAVTKEDIKEALQRTHLMFDKKGEEFYNLTSALHKSMRGSDANASLYWLARMLEAGADPLYVARRVLRFACEDIGIANSQALIQCNAAYDACHKIGMPECTVHLAQAVVYCAMSKKSNTLYRGYEDAAMDARKTSELGVPIHLRNAPTKFMKNIGYGKEYKYSPEFDYKEDQDYLPKQLKNKRYIN